MHYTHRETGTETGTETETETQVPRHTLSPTHTHSLSLHTHSLSRSFFLPHTRTPVNVTSTKKLGTAALE